VSPKIDAATEDAESGDIIHNLALSHDEGVTLISYDERADFVEDGDSYAVYDSSTDRIEFTAGDEYADASEVEMTFATTPATSLDSVDVASVASAYEGSELGIPLSERGPRLVRRLPRRRLAVLVRDSVAELGTVR